MNKREIRFKAKRLDNGKWIYGGILIDKHYNQAFIINHTYANIEVDIDTVCQYTGVKDKNDIEIYENDICKSDWGFEGIVEIEQFYFSKMECTISEEIEVTGNVFNNKKVK